MTGRPARVRPRHWLLAAATVCGLLAPALAAAASTLPWYVGTVAALLSLGTWHPRVGRWASTAAPLGCVVLLAGSDLVVAGGLCGLLALLHLLLADVADDAYGAAGRDVVVALRRLAPGFAVGVVGLVLLLLVLALVDGRRLDPVLVAAPLLLLTAVLLALGLATRRAFWGLQVRRDDLSEVTKRYLDRAGLRT
jgi:hypothetical protein